MTELSYNRFEIGKGNEIWHFINCSYEEYISDFEDLIDDIVEKIQREQEFNQEIYDNLWEVIEYRLKKILYFIVPDNKLVQLYEEDIVNDVVWEINSRFQQMKKKLISTYDKQH